LSFKKKKLRTKGPRWAAYGVWLLSVWAIFIFGAFLIHNISAINFDIIETVSEVVSIGEETQGVDKQDIGDKDIINILITGRWGGDHDAPNLTDTIILASIQKQQSTVSMLSIPRDLYVDYEAGREGRINEIYRNNLNKYNSKTAGMKALKDKITEITGQEIDYYMNVDFEGFTQVVDIFDGIDITLDETFIDDLFPDGAGWHTTFMIKKWSWTLSGETALKYVRSRHSTSDFDRSLRQQQVLSALKDKVISNGLLKNTSKIKELYQVFSKYVETDLSLWEMVSLASFAKQDYSIISSNLNDSCFYGTENCEKWWFLYIPQRDLFGWASVLLLNGTQKWRISDYSSIQPYFDIVFNKTGVFSENYIINVFNGSGESFLASSMADNIKKYGFNVPAFNSIGNTNKIYENSVIYYNSVALDSQTIQALTELIPKVSFVETSYPKYAKFDAQIEIVLWKDHANIFNF